MGAPKHYNLNTMKTEASIGPKENQNYPALFVIKHAQSEEYSRNYNGDIILVKRRGGEGVCLHSEEKNAIAGTWVGRNWEKGKENGIEFVRISSATITFTAE